MSNQDEITKIQHAASVAADVVAQAAADAKLVISQAASAALQALMTASAVQSRDIEYIKKAMDALVLELKDLDKRYVSYETFRPVQAIAFGLVGLVMVAVIGALIATVLVK